MIGLSNFPFKVTLNPDGSDKVNEFEEVEKALKHTDLSLAEFARKAILRRARHVNSTQEFYEKLDLESWTDDQLKNSKVKGSATQRVKNFVKKLMDYNDSQTEQANKFFISQNLVKVAIAANHRALKEFFHTYRVMLDDHNIKHNLIASSNQTGNYKVEEVNKVLKKADFLSDLTYEVVEEAGAIASEQ